MMHGRSISIWFVTLLLQINMFYSAKVLCSLTSRHLELEYLSAKCLKCMCERFNKERLPLCSSTVYGNAELWLYIIHISLHTESLISVGISFPFSLVIHYMAWIQIQLVFNLAAQSFKTYCLFMVFQWRSIDPLEDQRATVKLVSTCLTRMKLAPYTLWWVILWECFPSDSLITQHTSSKSNGNQSTGGQEVFKQKV